MNSTSENFNPLLIRTDFSDESTWEMIREGIEAVPSDLQEGVEAMRAINEAAEIDVSGYDRPIEFVKIVNDSKYADKTIKDVMELAAPHDVCVFVVDRETISKADHPVLVIDLGVQRGRSFRSIPSEVWGIASNLPIANMDWEDFADSVDHDGVFRGFAKSDP